MSEKQSKKPWLSKSIWAGVLVAVAPFIPMFGEKINESVAMSIVGVVMVVLRLITKSEIKLKD
jgi:hypothetical protein